MVWQSPVWFGLWGSAGLTSLALHGVSSSNEDSSHGGFRVPKRSKRGPALVHRHFSSLWLHQVCEWPVSHSRSWPSQQHEEVRGLTTQGLGHRETWFIGSHYCNSPRSSDPPGLSWGWGSGEATTRGLQVSFLLYTLLYQWVFNKYVFLL